MMDTEDEERRDKLPQTEGHQRDMMHIHTRILDWTLEHETGR